MKKAILNIIISLLVLTTFISCNINIRKEALLQTEQENTELIETVEIVETKQSNIDTQKTIKEQINKSTEHQDLFNVNNSFNYIGDNKYLKVITEDLINISKEMFDDEQVVEIPTPYIVKIDDEDKNNIKVYGDFWIYGYSLDGTIFNMENGGQNPGCYYLKEEDDNIEVINHQFAEDGSRFFSSLVEICEGDEDLVKQISNISHEGIEELYDENRIKYIKMYADDNNIKISAYKDYGWPTIIFRDTTDATFVYDFYKSYFDEIRQEDILNDMVERIDYLKSLYMINDLINMMEEKTMDFGADMIINAQDVTDEMVNTLEVIDYGDGSLLVHYDNGTEEGTSLKIQLETINNKRLITSIS